METNRRVFTCDVYFNTYLDIPIILTFNRYRFYPRGVIMEYVTLSYENESTVLESCEDTSKVRTCQACGKQFVYKDKRQKFCTRVHYRICIICGKEFTVDLTRGIDHLNQTCSRDCANILTKESLAKYREAHPIEKKETLVPGSKILTCEFCGKEFEATNHIVRRYCSQDCRREARKLKFQSTTRVCVLCGKEFHPVNTRNYICGDTHYRPCPICGKDVEVKQACDSPRVCSSKCKEELKRRTAKNDMV